jgi:hypothetical protein
VRAEGLIGAGTTLSGSAIDLLAALAISIRLGPSNLERKKYSALIILPVNTKYRVKKDKINFAHGGNISQNIGNRLRINSEVD